MDDSNVYQLAKIRTISCQIAYLARSPPLAVIVLIICGIVILPAIFFIYLTIVALFLTAIGLLEIKGEMMLYKIMFFGFLMSVAIIFLVTSGTIFAWYYGLIRMYQSYFNFKQETPRIVKEHTL